MKKVIFLGILTATTMALSQVKFKNPVTWGTPAYGGTGCLSEDPAKALKIQMQNNILQVQFVNFNMQVDANAQRIARKNCSLRIPVTLEAGYQLVMLNLESNGLVLNNQGFSIEANTSAGFVGAKTPINAFLTKPENYIGELNLIKSSGKVIMATSCSHSHSNSSMLEINTSLTTTNQTSSAKGQINLLLTSAKTQLSVRKCP